MIGSRSLQGRLARWYISIAGLIATAALTLLAFKNDGVYVRVMKVAMGLPARTYFADWSVTPTVLYCHRHGVNVYVPNHCSLLFNYSPAWLLLPQPPMGPMWDIYIGFGIAIGFLVSLALLAPPQSRIELAVRAAATLSSSIAFALERGNVDAIFFVAMLLAALLIGRSARLRSVGYLAFIVGALLKFYPAAALFTVLRERVPLFLTIAAVALGGAGWLVIAYHSEVANVLGHLPGFAEWTMEFSSKTLPGDLAERLAGLAHAPDHAAAIAGVLRPVMAVAMVAAAIAAWRRCVAREARMPAQQTVAVPMVVGAAVLLFCFMAGQNYLYRSVFFLMILPGLFAIAREADERLDRAVMATSGAIVFVCFMPTIRELFIFVRLWRPIVEDAMWLACQLAWWGIATALTTILIGFFVDSNVGALLLRNLPRGRISRS